MIVGHQDAAIAPAAPMAAARPAPRSLGALELTLVALLALLPCLALLDHPPHVDELYHVMAAHSLITDGTLRINGGEPYTRATLVTYITAGMFRLFGESLVVARVIPLLAGVALVVVLFAWLRHVAGRTAAWTTAVLLALDPSAIEYAQMVRFYTLQPLFFWLGVIGLYTALQPGSARHRAPAGALAAVGFALALHLQSVTLIGLAGVALWVGGLLLQRALAHPRRAAALGGLAALLVVGLAAAVGSGALGRLMDAYLYVPTWALADQYNWRYYYWHFAALHPVLFALLPLLALLGLTRTPRPVTLCLAIFAVAFVLHSLAPWKHVRYMAYARPAFYAVAGMGIAVLLPWLQQRVSALAASVWPGARSPAAARAVANGLLAAAALLALLVTPAVARSRAYALGLPSAYGTAARWELAAERLRPLADSAAVVAATSKLAALYYLRDVDVVLHGPESPGGAPDQWDGQVNLPTVGSLAAVRELLAHPSGLIVVDDTRWRRASSVTDAAADLIEARTERVPLPESWNIRAYRWPRR
ncbi:MAG TPA: glycosyltransferase family 39 protein [Gemmatimonadaceae bacterium]|nr:glycosyltransferase family 39 protein [Gemmatimonadaceae bacterium]